MPQGTNGCIPKTGKLKLKAGKVLRCLERKSDFPSYGVKNCDWQYLILTHIFDPHEVLGAFFCMIY